MCLGYWSCVRLPNSEFWVLGYDFHPVATLGLLALPRKGEEGLNPMIKCF